MTFANAGAVDTAATFSQAGAYTLRLTANDGALSGSDDVARSTVRRPAAAVVAAVAVAAVAAPRTTACSTSSRATLPPMGTSQPGTRIANAGPDPDRHPPERGNLGRHGHRRRAGRTRPAPVTTTWEKVTGFGTVTFGNPNAVDTTAQFSVEGTYVLRLTTNDGQAGVADDITVTVAAAAPRRGTARVRLFTKSVVAVGERTQFKGAVSPAAAGQPVLLQRRKNGNWVTLAIKQLEAGSSSAYTFNFLEGQRTLPPPHLPAEVRRPRRPRSTVPPTA